MVSTKDLQNQFPKVVEAARALDAAVETRWTAQFELGDALVQECGSPGANGVNNGALIKAAKVLAALKLNHPYTFRRLEQFRLVAHQFEPRRRLRAISFDAHFAAGDPDTLDQIVKEAKERGLLRVPVRYVLREVARRKAEQRANTLERNRENASAAIVALHDAMSVCVKVRAPGVYFDKCVTKHIFHWSRDQISELAQKAEAAGWVERATNLRRIASAECAQAAE